MPKLSKNQFLTSRIPGSSKERLLMQLSRIDREWLRGQLWKAYREARKGKRRTEDEYRFEQNDMKNINRLTELILSGQYKPSAGVAFIVEAPVKREIFAAPFVDRVVHHFLFNMIIIKFFDKLENMLYFFCFTIIIIIFYKINITYYILV